MQIVWGDSLSLSLILTLWLLLLCDLTEQQTDELWLA